MDAIGRNGTALARMFAAFALVAATSSSAASVYKCRDTQGHIAYQDRVCAVTQQQSQIELLAAPAAAPASDHSRAPMGRGEREHKTRRPTRAARVREVMSWECRGAGGEVFYRHARCPKSIPDPRAAAGSRKQGAKPVKVSATPLPRAEACRRLARAGSIGRRGHEHDESVSTYDRNAGRDPCRRY
ncbi:DUF4124 domain-containing protein [Dokdonella sp.]|uniref:DUF4124 domain-containing protein n=1 Tax=Dokdonella sp. TaxID=2291710 RepID=UPI0037836F76